MHPNIILFWCHNRRNNVGNDNKQQKLDKEGYKIKVY